MNIGVEGLIAMPKAVQVPSMETIFSQYVGCEQLIASTDRFSAYGDQLMDAFENLCSIGRTAKKFGSTEGLAVIDALVGQEFGGHVSMEALKETASKVWAKIKEWFAKIAQWIKVFFQRVLNFCGGAEKRLTLLKKNLEDSKGQVAQFKYNALPRTIPVKGSLDNMTEEQLTAEIAKYTELKLEEKSVDTKAEAIREINKLLEMLKNAPEGKGICVRAWTACKGLFQKAEKAQNVGDAKLAQKRMAANVKIHNKLASLTLRAAASFMANCKMLKPLQTKKNADGKTEVVLQPAK